MARKSRRAGTVSADYEKIDIYKYKVAVYARLSREREETIERGTIENQVEFVTDYVRQHDDMEIVDCYVDDAFSGTNFDRPGYSRMICDMKAGRFNTIVVKDLSRLGREYVEVGNLIERVFPVYGVRFIAILDNYDTLNRDSGIMMPVANIANTLYALDISKKIHSSKHSMMERGIPVSTPPYGYKLEKMRIMKI
jgi:DNA invertase Pin-like site-specific DNA recombinase